MTVHNCKNVALLARAETCNLLYITKSRAFPGSPCGIPTISDALLVQVPVLVLHEKDILLGYCMWYNYEAFL